MQRNRTALANNGSLVQPHILRVKIRKSDETLSNIWKFSDISTFTDIHQKAVHNTQQPNLSVSYQTLVKKFFLQEQIECKRKKKVTKEKKNGRKEERKLVQRESSSAKETG
jgi:hypothetical protein